MSSSDTSSRCCMICSHMKDRRPNMEKAGEYYCNNCGRYVCKSCAQSHQRMFSDHIILNISAAEPSPENLEALRLPNDWTCEQHAEEPVTHICDTCIEPMCFLCSFSPRHTSRNVKSVAIAFQDTFATLARSFISIKLTDQSAVSFIA